MNILVICPFLPYPQAKSGAPRAIYDRVLLLSRKHRVSVITFVAPDDAQHRTKLKKLGVRVYGAPRGDIEDMRGRRLWGKRARLAAGLFMDVRPMLVQEFGSKKMCGLIDRVTRAQRFDVVLLEHILMGQYARCIMGGPPVILTEHDVRGAFPAESVAGGSLASAVRIPLLLLDRLKWARYARRTYRGAAAVTVPTRDDARLLESKAPAVKAEVVPFGIPLDISPAGGDAESEIPVTAREQDTLLFVGNFDHPPNRDAAHWLCGEIMPLVWRERPSVRVWLVGRNPTPDIQALSGSLVRVWGEVPSVEKYLRAAALFVAPLHQGGGMRMKLLEAFGAGIPVVTTPLGAQGLDAENGKEILIAESADDFARCVLLALRDPLLRENLGRAGQRLISAVGRQEERAQMLENLLARVVALGKRQSAWMQE